jgi:hypothetical protein
LNFERSGERSAILATRLPFLKWPRGRSRHRSFSWASARALAVRSIITGHAASAAVSRVTLPANLVVIPYVARTTRRTRARPSFARSNADGFSHE